MKRILHIISQQPGKTGSGIYLQSLLREGRKKGHIQGLVAGVTLDDNVQLYNVDNFYPVIFDSEELPFPIVGMSDAMPYKSTKYCELTEDMLNKWKKAFKKIIVEAIDVFNPDIIFTHHLWLLTSLVREIAPNIKIIGICHGTDIRQFMKCSKYREEVLMGCGKLDLVFSLSQEQKELINRLYYISKEKIVVIGGGYNSDIFYNSYSDNSNSEIKLIYVGKLSYAKGIVSLLNAYEKIKDKYSIKLLLVGSGVGDEERYIHQLGQSLGSSVEFLGELTQDKLGHYFRESHIFILPSFYEGLSLATLEALASGLLVVVTSIPSLKSYLGKTINNSGVIEYVQLPSMMEVDVPIEKDLVLFEENLKLAIEKQIAKVYKDFTINDLVKDKIDKMSWENIFNKIEKYFYSYP